MEKELNEDEDFWDFKSNQVKSPPFQAKSKKDEFNINNRKEEINNNNQEEKRQQSKDHIDADDKGIGGAEDRSFRIEKLIKSLDKLKPAHRDRDEMSESQRSNAVNDDRHFDSLTDENKIKSKNVITYAATDSDGSGNDGETHGANSRDKKGKRDLKLDDGKSNDNNTDRSADGFGHHKRDEEVVPAHSSGTHRSNDPDEAESKTLDGYDTFIDYEGAQLKRDSPRDGLISNDDSEEKTFKVHPPKSGDPRRSRRQTRKPNVDAKTSKSHHHSVNGQDFDNQRQVKDDDDDDDQGKSCDEIQHQRLSQEAEASGKENASTPNTTQIRKSRNRKVNEKRGSTHEDSGKDGTGDETEGSRSPPRLRKGLRSGDYDWSQSGNEEMKEWVKQKNRIARKQKAEDKRKERIRKQEEAEGEVTGLVGDQERKSVESLERKKKQKPKQRSSSCPGDGGAGDRKVLPRSRSQPRMSKVLRSGDFDWSTSKNDEIRVWLKKKKRLIRKKRAEERKKEKMKKKEEEQKRQEHEEMYADSSERVSEWMKLKRRQEYLQRKKQKEEQAKAGQENEKVMVIGRRMNYESSSPTEKQAPEKHEEPALKTDQKQEDLLKSEQPLLKQREKQRRLLLSTGPKQPINRNKTLNSCRLPKENERKEVVSKRPANQAQQVVNNVEEITLPNTETITSLPSTDRRSSGVKTPNRRVNEAVVLPRQSLSTPKVNNPTGIVRVGTEPENIKKKITFDEWLKNKKTDDERKRVSDQAAKEQGKNLGELNKSVEILKISLEPEKRSVPTGSAENVSKRAIRPKSAIRQQKQPQVKQEQETVTSQRQDSPENKRSQAVTIDNVSDMRQLMAETSENSPRSSRSSSKKGTRSNESDKMAASDLATNKVSDHPHKVRGGNIPATALRAKSPKPKVAVRPTLRSVNYQQDSWEKFSDYMWDEVNENEGGEVTTNRDKPTRAEAEITEANFERKAEKPEGNSRRDKKVEASAGFHGNSEFRESRLDMDLELNGSENIVTEISRMPLSRNDDIHTIIDAEEEETETELDNETRAELKMETKAESRREIQMESKSLGHGQSRGAVDKVRGIAALPPRSSPGHRVHFSGSEEEIMSDLEILG